MIQLFLPEGEPRGIRIAGITTQIAQAVLVPRSKLRAPGWTPDQPPATRRDFGAPFVRVSETEACIAKARRRGTIIEKAGGSHPREVIGDIPAQSQRRRLCGRR